MGDKLGATQWRELAAVFETFRVFEVDAAAARRPSPMEDQPALAADAGNLASFLYWLSRAHQEVFELLVDDLRFIVPSVRALVFESVGGPTAAIKLALEEEHLRGATDLAYASFGTIRALALLAMLHDPNPPKLTCVEEIDHGLHPYALDRIVERLRSATRKTQLLLATHSPALVNRLEPEELIVCERDPSTGASRIPAIDPAEVKAVASKDDLGLGELWFSGTLGGVL
jgi:predicted ATPase